MISYNPADTFHASPANIYAVSDFVIGGNAGVSNTPLKALFDNTNWLYNRLGKYEDVFAWNGNYTYDPADRLKLFAFDITAHSSFFLPDATVTDAGTIIPITVASGTGKCLAVTAFSAQTINNGNTAKTTMWMYDGERLVLVCDGTGWIVLLANGNFDNVGISFGARIQKKNTVILQGQLLNRADFPRLFEEISAMTVGSQVVSDAAWLANGFLYTGCFSLGNGTTTFRLPDERAMHDRYLDLGRGVDLSRGHNAPGGYEGDDNKSHTHTVTELGDRNLDGVSTFRVPNSNTDFTDAGGVDVKIKATGSLENTVKTIGKIPLMYY